MIKTIGFDLGYTLVYLKREDNMRTFLKEFMEIDIPYEDIQIAYHVTDKTFMREYQHVLGNTSEKYYIWYFSVLLYQMGIFGVDLLKTFGRYVTFMEKSVKEWHPYPWSRETLEHLKEKGYQLVLVSNWDESCRKVLKDARLDDLFDETIISCEVGVEKPDPRIFEIALEKTGIQAEEFFFVGDNYYDDVLGSGELGIEAAVINPFDKLGIEELEHVHVISSVQELERILEKERQ